MLARILVWGSILYSTFTYGQVPVIYSFSPAAAPVGASVTIHGSNFSSSPGSNTVYFGGVKATVTSATTSTLTVNVPDGATPEPLSVTTSSLTGYSRASFMTTFSGGSATFIGSSFGAPVKLTTGLYPFSVCATDLDGDGKPDLISPGNANSPNSIISYRRNTGGTGTLSFGPEVDLPAPAGSFPYNMVTADLDGDGRQDVVFCASTASLCVYPNTGAPGTISFGTRQDLATGTDPFSVAVGDLDGDGKPDVVVANYLSNTLSVYRNISTVGSIAFAPKIDLATDLAPHAVVIVDLDGDGKADLAAANSFSSTILLFRNQSTPGTLSFGTPTDLATGPDEPFGLAAGDIDGDGKPDLVVTYANFNQINGASVAFTVFRNGSSAGSFAFGSAQNYGTGNTLNPIIGDLNGDGKPEVVIPNGDANCYVYANASSSGTIVLGTPGKYYDLNAYAVAISDLDGDNIPDMAIANFVSNNISFFKNTTTAPGIASISPAIGYTGTSVTITGVNLGTVTNVSFGGVPATSFTINSPLSITAVVGAGATGDVNVTAPTGTGSYTGFTYTAPPRIASISPSSAGSGTTVTVYGTGLSGATAVSLGGVAVASFTVVGDTIVTAVVGAGASGDVVLVTPGGTATLQGGFTFISPPVITSFSPTTAAAGATITITGTRFTGASVLSFGGTPASSFTVNSSTSITAIVGGGSTGSLSVTTPGGTGTLAGFTYIGQAAPTLTAVAPFSGKIGTNVTLTGSGFDAVAANDVVYFGAVRAAVTSASASSLIVTVPAGASLRPISVTTLGTHLTAWSAQPFNVTFDTGAIQFAFPVATAMGEDLNNNICAGDLDGDGKADLVIATQALQYVGTTEVADNFIVVRNISSGGKIAFGPQQPIGSTFGNFAATIGDVDGDGKPDLIMLGYDTVYIFRNISSPGTIAFDTPAKYLTGYDGQAVAVADLDGDGKPDLITVNSFSGTISILRNTCTSGYISFTDRTDVPAGNSPSGVSVADFDGDGKRDVAVSSNGGNNVLVFRNQSAMGIIALSSPLSIAVGANPSDIQTGDLDGDGKPDIATSNYSDNTMSVIRNLSIPGSLNFATSVPFNNGYVVPAASVRLAIADMNGDGKPDLALINQAEGGTASVFRNGSTPGNMVFTHIVQAPYGVDVTITGRTFGVVMQDFDGDGRPDVAAVNDYDYAILQNQAGTQPYITSFSPKIGNDSSTITIYGRNFDSASAVSFGGYPANSFTVISPTEITAVPPVNSSGAVSVTTPLGTSSLGTFIYAAAPDVNEMHPAVGATGSTITLVGDNFLDVTGVSFGGTPATSFSIVDANHITAVVGQGSGGTITVTNPYGTGLIDGFIYWVVPTISSFTPTAGVPGTVVTITGTNFTGATSVTFGQTAADSYTVVSSTEITAVVGQGASGNVSVTSSDGHVNTLAGFVFDPTVQITAAGLTTFCQGDSVVLRSSMATNNQWYLNNAAISGATADTLLVTAGGSYTDELTFPNLPNGTSSPISVTVKSIPRPPVITAAPDSGLESSYSAGNQWYQDTLAEIPGANERVYVPKDSGYYAVTETSNGCTSALSSVYFYHLPVPPPPPPPPVTTTTTTDSVVASPNPVVGGRTLITYHFTGVNTLTAQLSDIQGHILLLEPDFPSGAYLDMSNMSKGMYFLLLRDADGKRYGKISIVKYR